MPGREAICGRGSAEHGRDRDVEHRTDRLARPDADDDAGDHEHLNREAHPARRLVRLPRQSHRIRPEEHAVNEAHRIRDAEHRGIRPVDRDAQARQIRAAFPQSVTVFVLPPSAQVLLDRLQNRKTESPQQLAARLHSALRELQAVDEYEYVVVNDDLDHAVKQVASIVDAEVVSRERVSGLRHQVEALVTRLEAEIGNHSLGKS